MDTGFGFSKIYALMTALVLATGQVCLAEPFRNTNGVPQADGQLQMLMEHKPQKEETVYETFFSSADGDIAGQYNNMLQAGAPVDTAGTVRSFQYSGVSDQLRWQLQSRTDLANFALRRRLTYGIRDTLKYFGKKSLAVQGVEKAQAAITKLRNQSVSVGSGPTPLTFRYGYDLITDVSQITCTKGTWSAGMVHYGFLSAVASGEGSRLANAFVNVSKSLGESAPRAFIGFPIRADSMEMGLAHTLAPGTYSTLRFSTAPIAAGAPNYEMIQATVQVPIN